LFGGKSSWPKQFFLAAGLGIMGKYYMK